MHELFPIMSGILVGFLLGMVRPSMRWPVGVGLAVALGTLATIVSGEFRIGWEFLLIDIPLVAFASSASYAVTRTARLAGAHTR